ncbi:MULTISPECIES: hypothetical protein [Proteiniphilum]|mgnify:CR=1 FL=1|jgi:hypothetical protein|uniref:hypothetical protein n=1 Tax=Proteiniphilum TaxID=294702 RepID=UPI001EECE9A8|nr:MULTISPECIES: hypothetical protein [Proteiniphilum]ULB34945.1 hypothetical protein KDN43_02505 [Proteiniphilum propionicum]
MKQLTQKLIATSLLETIVSSVIFMILFIIAMHSMTNLLVYENRQPNHLVIENDLKKCRQLIEKEGVYKNTKERYYSFPWGKIKVSIFPYKGDILLIHISSKIEGGQSTGYYFLHVNQE